MKNVPKTERNAAIVRLIEARELSLDEIGRRYGVTGKRICQIGLRVGVQRGRRLIPEDKIAAAHALAQRGIPLTHVADMVGIGRETIHAALVCRGFHTPTRVQQPWSETDKRFLARHYKTRGWPAPRIAARLGRTRNEVIGQANRLELCKPIEVEKTLAHRIRCALRENPSLRGKALAKRVGYHGNMDCLYVTTWLYKNEGTAAKTVRDRRRARYAEKTELAA